MERALNASVCMSSRSAIQDILTRFHGSWLVTPETNAQGQLVGCTAVLEQEVLPRGDAYLVSNCISILHYAQYAILCDV